MQSAEYLLHIGILICITAILAQGFNLSFGLSRLFNLAHIASYAVGAYFAAVLSTRFGWEFLPCVLASMVAAAAFSFAVGGIAARLTGDYFAIGTLAFSSVVSAILINWRDVTQGVLGIPGIPRPVIFGWSPTDNSDLFLIYLALLAIVQLGFELLFAGTLGRRLRAIGEFERGAQVLGINTSFHKAVSFALSSAAAGLAGALFAFYINYIDPSSFGFNEMIFVATIVIFGKPGSSTGCFLATAGLILLGEAMRFIPFSPGVLGPARQLVYAVVLFLVVFVNRHRLFPEARQG